MVGMEAQSSVHHLRAPFAAAVSQPGNSVADAAYWTLRRAIVMMILPPGRRLSEKEIGDWLEISRQPVREALLRLREINLIDVRAKSGSFVSRISVAAVQSARFVRAAVETAVVRRAAEGIAAPDAASIDDLLARQQEAARTRDAELFFKLDEEFHRTLAQAAGCAPAWKTIHEMRVQMDRVRYLSLPAATPLERLITQHWAVRDAIHARDAKQAMAAMETHLREITFSLPMLAKQYAQYFDDPGQETEAWRLARAATESLG